MFPFFFSLRIEASTIVLSLPCKRGGATPPTNCNTAARFFFWLRPFLTVYLVRFQLSRSSIFRLKKTDCRFKRPRPLRISRSRRGLVNRHAHFFRAASSTFCLKMIVINVLLTSFPPFFFLFLFENSSNFFSL